MKHLTLKRGLSYMGHGVHVTKAKPLVSVADDTQADALLASGYFAEVSEAEVSEAKAAETDAPDLFEDSDDETDEGEAPESGAVEAIDTMGVTKLREYAKKHGISGNWPAGTAADVIREDIRKALAERE